MSKHPLLQSTLINTTMYLDNQQTILNPFLGCAMSEIDAMGTVSPQMSTGMTIMKTNRYDGDGFGDNVEANDGDGRPFQKGNNKDNVAA